MPRRRRAPEEWNRDWDWVTAWGQVLQEAREAKGWDRKEMALRSGLTIIRITRVEEGPWDRVYMGDINAILHVLWMRDEEFERRVEAKRPRRLHVVRPESGT